MILGYKPAQIRKALIALGGAIVMLGNLALDTQGIVPDSASKWVGFVVAAVSALLVYAVPNEPNGDNNK